MGFFLQYQFCLIDLYMCPYGGTTLLIALTILGSLNLHVNCRRSLKISAADIWLENVLYLWINLENISIYFCLFLFIFR